MIYPTGLLHEALPPLLQGSGKSAETSATFPSGLQAYWNPTNSPELTSAAEEAEGALCHFLAPTGISIRPCMLWRQQRALQIPLLSEHQTWWFTACSPCVEMWSAQTCSLTCFSSPFHAPFGSPTTCPLSTCPLSLLPLRIVTFCCDLIPAPETPLYKVLIYLQVVKFSDSVHPGLIWPPCGMWLCLKLASVLVTLLSPSCPPSSLITFGLTLVLLPPLLRTWFFVLCSSVYLCSRWWPCLSLRFLSTSAYDPVPPIPYTQLRYHCWALDPHSLLWIWYFYLKVA